MELSSLDILGRLAAAALVGAIIGTDREVRNKPAGLRTHALVSLGAGLLTVVAVALSDLSSSPGDSISRVLQGIVAGIGFLGAGAILKEEQYRDIKGLTTAASIWVVAALGVACGAGLWRASIAAVVLALLILIVGEPVERLIRKTSGRRFEEPVDEPKNS